mgnify:CR=1 FL=1
MKIQLSTSATKLTPKLLIDKLQGTFHGGMQKSSNVKGRDYLWNFVKIVDNRTEAVLTQDEASGIVCEGKYYKL